MTWWGEVPTSTSTSTSTDSGYGCSQCLGAAQGYLTVAGGCDEKTIYCSKVQIYLGISKDHSTYVLYSTLYIP